MMKTRRPKPIVFSEEQINFLKTHKAREFMKRFPELARKYGTNRVHNRILNMRTKHIIKRLRGINETDRRYNHENTFVAG